MSATPDVLWGMISPSGGAGRGGGAGGLLYPGPGGCRSCAGGARFAFGAAAGPLGGAGWWWAPLGGPSLDPRLNLSKACGLMLAVLAVVTESLKSRSRIVKLRCQVFVITRGPVTCRVVCRKWSRYLGLLNLFLLKLNKVC